MALDEVRRLIERLSPDPVCDDCIAARLDLDHAEDADRLSRELAGSAGFERIKAACSLCGQTRIVTHKVRA